MQSCLYECRTTHQRFTPRSYKFSQSFFMFCLDLDELKTLKLKGIYEFRDSDHLQFGKNSAKENVLEYLRQNGVSEPVSQVLLLTNLRFFGYIFNPVSFYFCFDANRKPLALVAEVGNTFGELKAYFLGRDCFKSAEFSDRQTKFYYISPFIDLDAELHFSVALPKEQLSIRVDDWKGGQKILATVLTGKKKELCAKNLWINTLRFPFVTLQIIFMIHWHALVLSLKKIPHRLKEDRPDLQRDVQRRFRSG